MRRGVELKFYAVGRRHLLTACVEKEQDNNQQVFPVPAKAATWRFAPQPETMP